MELRKIKQSDLIRALAGKTGLKQKDVKTLLDGLEIYLIDTLSEASDDYSIQINILKGLIIESNYISERITINPKTKEEKLVQSDVKVKASIQSKSFRQKVLNVLRAKRERDLLEDW